MSSEAIDIVKKMRGNLSKGSAEVGKRFVDAKKKGEKEKLDVFNSLKGELDGYNKEVAAFNASIDKLHDEVGKAFAAARKEYTDIVAQTKGLTSVKPSVVKSLEQLRDTLDTKYAKEAAAGLQKHKDEVVKQHKGDAAAMKFTKELDKLIANYKL